MRQITVMVLALGWLSICGPWLGCSGQEATPCERDSECRQDWFCNEGVCQETAPCEPACRADLCEACSNGMCRSVCLEEDQACRDGLCERLAWQDDPGLELFDQASALSHCQDLADDSGLAWRLPSIAELRSLVDGCPISEPGGECGVGDGCLSSSDCNNEQCAGCVYGETCYWHYRLGPCGHYWSSSPVDDQADKHWVIDFRGATITSLESDTPYSVRCVRWEAGE